MTRRSVRRIFLVVAVALPLQWIAVGILSSGPGEPWPAVVLPGFTSIWDGSEDIRMPEAELIAHFESGISSTVSPRNLFEGIPASHHLGILREHFQPASISGSERTERARADETRQWLAQRLSTLYPDRQPRRLDAVWYGLRFLSEDATIERIPNDTLTIDLLSHAPTISR